MKLEETDDSYASNGDGPPARTQDQEKATAAAIKQLLGGIPGENADREGLQDTPMRFARAFADLTEGYTMSVEEEVTTFREEHDEMVVMTDIPVYSLCEHHLLPFFGCVHIAYIPDPKVGIIGLSKLKRIVDIFARRLQVQERLAAEIAESLNDLLKPQGVAVITECRHMCMEIRGVRCQGNTKTTTQKRLGVFQESSRFLELCAVVNTTKESGRVSSCDAEYYPSLQCASCQQNREEVAPTKAAEKLNVSVEQMSKGSPATDQGLNDARTNDSPVEIPKKDCDDYRLYLQCASNEPTRIAEAVQEGVTGPLSQQNPQGLSILDIGAGNGIVLKALCHATSVQVARYSAFEMDCSLCHELRSTASYLSFNDENSLILQSEFGVETTIEEAGGCADVVLLSHCLYGATREEKLALVKHALGMVSPGGILLVVHRWEAGGTIDYLSESLTSQSLLHNLAIWESELDISQLEMPQRARLNRYTKGDIPIATDKRETSARRLIGCIAIEPHSCDIGCPERVASTLERSRHQVGYMARKKTPAVVIEPNTIVGIQSCIRAASLRLFDGGLVVIGGGHSENAFADGAIAINMRRWNSVNLNSAKEIVTIGGGTTAGEVTEICERHGLVVPLGDRPGVGAGLILQGGLNHFMRKFGIACGNILKVIYVNPDGKLRAAASSEELFPFKGAGTNFGVVVEISMRAFQLKKIAVQDNIYKLPTASFKGIMTSYSRAAESLPNEACLDGFLFWSGHDEASFATSYFGISGEHALEEASSPLLLPLQDLAAQVGQFSIHSPSQLCDRELYMTDTFAPSNVLGPNQDAPKKLRSNKRCVFLPVLEECHESVFSLAMTEAPTKWCYFHFLHGGGAVAHVAPEDTAFGCRDWVFAVVITARWANGDQDSEKQCEHWLEQTTANLLPLCRGVYAADLGPKDIALACRAFGPNTMYLAKLKQQADPLNVLACACPIAPSEDPRVQPRGTVVIFCGPRVSGKDWLGAIATATLSEILGENLVKLASISDETKVEYAAENASVDVGKLLSNRHYKEEHRQSLSAFYKRKCAQNVAYDAKCYVKAVRESDDGSILLLTGMRDGLDYACRLAGKPVVLIRVKSSNEAKSARGWKYDATIDESKGELAADAQDTAFWDLEYENGLDSTPESAAKWTKQVLIPCILKRCTRSLADTPRPGVQYRDVFGSLLLQPFAMALVTESVVDWVMASGEESIDAIVAPEATGFAFASPIAALLKKPLILLRKGGSLAGDTDVAWYNGSNVHHLTEATQAEDSENNKCLEIICGSIVPGQRVLVVDDCLASGSTLAAVRNLVVRQGGAVTKVAVLMELPELSGRPKGLDVFSVMKFPGR